MAFRVLGSGGLGHGLVLLSLGREVDGRLVELHLTIDDTLVGGLDETKLINLGIDAKRGDKTDVGTFRSLDGAEAAVVGIVDVADLEACTLARQTAGAESRDTALVGELGQGVGLVHELAQLVGAEERVDDRRKGLGIDKLGGGEHLVVTHIHALADGATHAGETHAKLVGELLADSADTTVRQVVDIVHLGFLVDKLDQIFNDRGDVLLGQHADVVGDIKVQFGVDSVATHIAQIITFL